MRRVYSMTAASSARLLHDKSLKYIFNQYAEAQVDDQGKSFQDRLRNAQQQRADRHSLVFQGPSNPSDTSKNRRKSANACKEATSRCRARGRTRCCSGATVGGASDVGPPAAARGTQGAASYIIRGVRVVSMAKNSSKQAGLETDVTRCRHHAARRARARPRRDRV